MFKNHTLSHWVLMILCSLLVIAACVIYSAAIWYADIFGLVGFNSILFTLTNDVGAANAELFQSYMIKSLLPGLGVGLLISAALWFRLKKEKPTDRHHPSKQYIFRDRLSLGVSLIIVILLLVYTAEIVGIDEYIKNYRTTSDLLEKEYVEPNSANITFNAGKRNLIVLYMESMETTFLDQDHGGGLTHNCIPELYDLAQKNINFSHNDDVGGFLPVEGTTWTIGALVGTSSGVPLVTYGMDGNGMGANDYFLNGLTTINDVLHQNGYYQTLMVGSDAEFGGRKKYFSEHGIDKIYDVATAEEDGIIPQGYRVWWGMEDKYLYEYAKQELSEISKKDQPFNFTMLTVDTHHVNGYACSECGNKYAEQYENVYACASKQADEFIQWLKKQPFYKDTTIVITGDHPSMDQEYMTRNVASDYERHVYNCFINAVPAPSNTKNRIFTTLDIFPSTLAAMGCKFDNDRLGLGVNLFSDQQTLAEKYGIIYFKSLIAQNSNFYDEHFKFTDAESNKALETQ